MKDSLFRLPFLGRTEMHKIQPFKLNKYTKIRYFIFPNLESAPESGISDKKDVFEKE